LRFGDRSSASLRLRSAAAGAVDEALVVHTHESEYVIDVVVVLDPSSGRALRVREHGVRLDPVLLHQLAPDGLGEVEVGRTISMQVTDLTPANTEGEFAPAPWSGLDAIP
jgi:hypothetical protein